MQDLISLVRGYSSPRQSCELSPANSRVSFMQSPRNPEWLTRMSRMLRLVALTAAGGFICLFHSYLFVHFGD